MSEKQKKKNKIIGISIGILVVLLVVISSTYAYWQITKSQEGSNDIIAACLDIDMQSVDGTFGLDPAWPISDTEGMNLKGYTFKVTNNCEEDVNYIIGMDSLEVNGVDYLDYNSIKVSIDDSASMIYGDKETIDHIEENDQYTIRTSKKIATSTVKYGQPNEHNVKVWIKSDAPIEEQSRVFSGRMFITGGQNIEVEPQVKLIATGDISRTENDNVAYRMYDNGDLIISGTGATKQYLPNENDMVSPLFGEIIKQYVENETIELTAEEENILYDENYMLFIMLLLNDNDSQLASAMDDTVTTIEEFKTLLSEVFGVETLEIMESLVIKISSIPKIKNVVIEDGITSIGDNTFGSMIFENLDMANSVVELKEGAFATGGFTDSYKLSNNIQVIEDFAFAGLVYTGSLKIPDSVTQLGLIIGNSDISEIILPANKNVTKIEYGFFDSTDNLISVVIPENIVTMYNNFADGISNTTLKFYGPERNFNTLDFSMFKEVIWNYQGE